MEAAVLQAIADDAVFLWRQIYSGANGNQSVATELTARAMPAIIEQNLKAS